MQCKYSDFLSICGGVITGSMSLSDIETQKSYKYLYEVETLAQNILTLKEERLELENGRNKVREAFRALEAIDKRRTWMQVGQVYVERPTAECKGLLKDGKQQNGAIDYVLCMNIHFRAADNRKGSQGLG